MTAPTPIAIPTATVTADELLARLGEPDLHLIDLRPLAAYNGWHLGGESRGGHIPGAAAFPIQWLRRLSDIDLQAALTARGVDADDTIVVYGHEPSDADAFELRLASLGLHGVVRLEGDWPAWSADDDRPVENLPRFERLVPVDWLRDLLAGRTPEVAPSGRWLLFHVNFGVPEEYAEDHIPTALYLDTNRLEDPVTWNRRSPAELETALQSLGIDRDTTVVLYGRDTEGDANEKWPGRRAGQIAATRAALILRYAGVDDVRLLDGGYDHWVQAGNRLETIASEPIPVASSGLAIPEHPELIVDIDEAKDILADRHGAALVSVRTWREHIGAVSGYNYIGPAGRIAGDVWGNCGTDAYHMQHYRTVDNTMRPYPEIAANWLEAGITAEKLVAFYCGTGWRAAETWFYADLMGWSRIGVYDGGWFEWSRDPLNNPIEVGEPVDEAEGSAVA